jgi:predicted Zn-dependent protease
MLAAACSLSACANQQFNDMGSNLLSQTGLMSDSQARSLLGFGSSVSNEARGLTPEEEYYLGRSVAATILARDEPYRDAAVNAYVNEVAAVLAAHSDAPETFGGYHVQVLDTPEINAVSAPGGFIFISTGFLRIIPDEDALAAVLAHEIGHIVKRHGVKAISESNLGQAALLLGQQEAQAESGQIVQQLTSTFGDSVSDITNTLLSKGYSRSQEYEADAYSAQLLARSGYNPQSLKGMLTKLEMAAKGAPEGGWFSTHPEPADRIGEVAGVLEKLPQSAAGEAVRARRFSKELRRLG